MMNMEMTQVLGRDSLGCRIFMVLGFDLIHGASMMAAGMRKVRFINDTVPLV